MDKTLTERWLEPLDNDSTGEDLEYDPTSLELSQAANGRPETQFGPAEPPSWTTTRELAESLFDRNRDLRTAMLWTRAVVRLEGLEGLAAGLFLLHGLLERFWETLHPRPDPDDGDTFARLSTLGALDSLDGLLGDIRQSPLLADRRLGSLRMRDVEIALDRLPPRADETMSTPGQIQGQIADNPDLAERLRTCVSESLASLKSLQSLMNDRFGMDNAVDVKQLRLMLTGMQSLLPSTDAGAAADGADGADGDAASGSDDAAAAATPSGARRATGGVHSVDSRQDAVRAIQLVCAYLERSEPTNPAQLMLRRAERLIDKNFLQLIKDFAPESMRDVARVLGVDPSSLEDE